jgi:hypothetical protein
MKRNNQKRIECNSTTSYNHVNMFKLMLTHLLNNHNILAFRLVSAMKYIYANINISLDLPTNTSNAKQNKSVAWLEPPRDWEVFYLKTGWAKKCFDMHIREIRTMNVRTYIKKLKCAKKETKQKTAVALKCQSWHAEKLTLNLNRNQMWGK